MIAFKGIKKVLFGYSKKDVINYIELLNEDLNSRIYEKDRQVKEVLEQNNAFMKRLEQMEKNQDEVLHALINARNAADNIILDARKQADKIVKDSVLKKEMQIEQYENVKDDFEKFKKSVTKALKGFVKEAENIKKDCDEACKLNNGSGNE